MANLRTRRTGDGNSHSNGAGDSKSWWRRRMTTAASHMGEEHCRPTCLYAEKIFEFYNSREVTTYHAQQQYITPCERVIFETYIKPGMAILDIGVGGGRTTEYLSKNCSRYVGIDYAPAMLEICRKKYPQWEFFADSATDLSRFDCGSFDAVVMSYNTLDDVIPDDNRWRCLRECHRVLSERGLLIFSSHNPRAIIIRPNWWGQWNNALWQIAGRPSNGRFAYSPRLPNHLTTILSAIKESFHRIRCYVWKAPFWRGEGHMLDTQSLMTHFWVPAKAIGELTRVGFKFNALQGDDYPLRSHTLTTEWYYYVFSKAG